MERHQVWIYLAAALLGLGLGSLWPETAGQAEPAVWPLLGLLLFATFTQTPLTRVPAAFRQGRFLVAALVGNFLILPLVAWALVGPATAWAEGDPAVRLGLLLVLLVPCTDWFITFARLGGGDSTLATALTPVNLVVQLALLPLYLTVMTGPLSRSVFSADAVWPAVAVVLGPLVVAVAIEPALRGPGAGRRWRTRLGLLPVPLLAVVILCVAAVNVEAVREAPSVVPVVAAVVVAFLLVALVVAGVLARIARLPARPARTLAFSFGTRNSFLVLPFALALPAGWELAAVVVVLQSLVELLGMIGYLWLVPRAFSGRRRDRTGQQRERWTSAAPGRLRRTRRARGPRVVVAAAPGA